MIIVWNLGIMMGWI